MCRAINFNNNLCVETGEVNDIVVNRDLAAKLEAKELSVAQMLP